MSYMVLVNEYKNLDPEGWSVAFCGHLFPTRKAAEHACREEVSEDFSDGEPTVCHGRASNPDWSSWYRVVQVVGEFAPIIYTNLTHRVVMRRQRPS